MSDTEYDYLLLQTWQSLTEGGTVEETAKEFAICTDEVEHLSGKFDANQVPFEFAEGLSSAARFALIRAGFETCGGVIKALLADVIKPNFVDDYGEEEYRATLIWADSAMKKLVETHKLMIYELSKAYHEELEELGRFYEMRSIRMLDAVEAYEDGQRRVFDLMEDLARDS